MHKETAQIKNHVLNNTWKRIDFIHFSIKKYQNDENAVFESAITNKVYPAGHTLFYYRSVSTARLRRRMPVRWAMSVP